MFYKLKYTLCCILWQAVYWECLCNVKSDRLAWRGIGRQGEIKTASLHQLLSPSLSSASVRKHEKKARWPVASCEECLINLTGRKWMVQPDKASHGDTLYTPTITTLQLGICQPFYMQPLTSQDGRGNGKAAFLWNVSNNFHGNADVSSSRERNSSRGG